MERRSKEISKSNVVDDMVASNKELYKAGETPDHVVSSYRVVRQKWGGLAVAIYSEMLAWKAIKFHSQNLV